MSYQIYVEHHANYGSTIPRSLVPISSYISTHENLKKCLSVSEQQFENKELAIQWYKDFVKESYKKIDDYNKDGKRLAGFSFNQVRGTLPSKILLLEVFNLDIEAE